MANMIGQSLLCKVLDAPDLEILHSNGVVEEMFLTCQTISSVRDNIIAIFIPAHWYRFLQLFYLLFEVLDRLNTIFYKCLISMPSSVNFSRIF